MKGPKLTPQRKPPVVCSIGSTDPTVAAGLFLDAAVYAAIGDVRPAYVVAGVTAQNSRRVTSVDGLKASAVIAQLDAVLAQVRPAAVRIGVIPSNATALAIARRLQSLRRKPPIVLDPVMTASSGARLIEAGEPRGLRALLRVATIATPNAHEAAELTGIAVRTVKDAERAALVLTRRYGCAVLVTGGHLPGGDRVVDVLARGDRITRYSAWRLSIDVRGTGCMLATAIAASLAHGASLDRAVRRGRQFVRRAIQASMPLGRGRRQFAGVHHSPV